MQGRTASPTHSDAAIHRKSQIRGRVRDASMGNSLHRQLWPDQQTVQNQSQRLITAAMRSTPTQKMEITGLQSLEDRKDTKILIQAATFKRLRNHPMNKTKLASARAALGSAVQVVLLQCVHAHCGIRGNERADKLVREGAQKEQINNRVSYLEVKTIIKTPEEEMATKTS